MSRAPTPSHEPRRKADLTRLKPATQSANWRDLTCSSPHERGLVFLLEGDLVEDAEPLVLAADDLTGMQHVVVPLTISLVVAETWILQSNPKLYDIDASLQTRTVIYWRVPQFFEQLKTGDRALIWRSGKQAGIVGWGVLLSDPQHYDLSGDDDPFIKSGFPRDDADWYVPVRVWPGREVPKTEVAVAIPENRIVIAPMGTVFRLDTDDVAALGSLLDVRGYELTRPPEVDISLLPVLPELEVETTKKKEWSTPLESKATITPAMFLLSSTPDRPVEITIEGDSLRLSLLERDALKALGDDWDAVGVYLLLGKPTSEDAVLSVYVGKAQGLRSRIKTGHTLKEWMRCLVIQREGVHAFNASDISWLERRLLDVLLEAPDVDVVNKTPPPPEVVPDYKAEILERTVVATLGVLGVLGAHIA